MALSAMNSLQVYPNPAQDVIYIHGEFESIGFYDAQGRQIFVSKQSRIDVSSLSEGVYLLKVEMPSGMVLKRIASVLMRGDIESTLSTHSMPTYVVHLRP